ncbi:MAG: type II secretion system protein [Phycisphaerales bacterium]
MNIRLGHRRPVTCAYTLIELLIVIAVLGIAGALLIPHLAYKDSLASQAAVRLVISDLSFAQSDALANQEFRRVYFYPDGSGYCILRVTEADFDDPFDPNTANYIDDPLGVVGDSGGYIVDFTTRNRFDNVSINSVNFDGGNLYVTYDALGGTVITGNAPGTGGQLRVQAADDIYQIDITPFVGKLTVTKIP